jgi:hypothetical protein
MNASAEVQDYWKNQIADFLKSGLDRKTYCEQNNLKMHSLDYWRAKLNPKAGVRKKKDSAKWVTLQVTDPPAGTAGVRVRIGRYTIEMDPGFNHETLADVLKVAAGC